MSEPTCQRPAPIHVVVLAAGRSTRMGRDKASLPIEGEPMIRRVVGLLAGLALPVVVVVGENAVGARASLEGLDVQVVENPSAETGMASSVVAGVEATPEDAAVLIVLGDMPWQRPETLAALVRVFRASEPGAIVMPAHRDRLGNPVLFDPVYRHELRALTGDEGGRRVWRSHRDRVRLVPVSDPRELDDVDTPDDLRAPDPCAPRHLLRTPW